MSDNLLTRPVEMNPCTHSQLTSYDNNFYCLQCGAYQSKDGQLTLKQNTKCYPALSDPIKVLQSQWNHSLKYQITNQSYLNQRTNLISIVYQWSEKLNLSYNTFFLAVQYMDTYFNKTDQTSYQLFSAASLMLAAKAAELDERIPFISKLKRCTYIPYTIKEIKVAECQLIKMMGWNLQKTTLVDWIDCISSIGFVFDGDELQRQVLVERNDNSNQQFPLKDIGLKEEAKSTSLKFTPSYKIRDLFLKIEKVTRSLTYLILNEPSLIQMDQQLLTFSTIKYIRGLVGLKNEKFLAEIFPNQSFIDLSATIPAGNILNHKFNQSLMAIARSIPYSNNLEYSNLQQKDLFQSSTIANLFH